MLKRIIIKILCLFIKPCIAFESVPNYSDNTRCVYDEMVKRKLNKKYYFIWFLPNNEISFLDSNGNEHKWSLGNIKTIKERIYSLSCIHKCKCAVCCNRFMPENICDTIFFLNHGAPLKSVNGYYNIPEHVKYVLSMSDYLSPFVAKDQNVPIDKIFSLGFPRNDILLKTPKDINKMLETECKKIIVWYPTYRKNKNSGIVKGVDTFPLIHNSEIAEKINSFAKEHNVLIVIKPHFAQDLSSFTKVELSNIRFIDDSFFVDNGISNYEFVSSCDALLTDYSSIYYDYTLCDKPIGLVWEDIEEYKKDPGFSVDIDYICKGGEKIYTVDDLLTFIKNLSLENDILQDERREIRDTVHQTTSGNSTELVTDYIIEKAGL